MVFNEIFTWFLMITLEFNYDFELFKVTDVHSAILFHKSKTTEVILKLFFTQIFFTQMKYVLFIAAIKTTFMSDGQRDHSFRKLFFL